MFGKVLQYDVLRAVGVERVPKFELRSFFRFGRFSVFALVSEVTHLVRSIMDSDDDFLIDDDEDIDNEVKDELYNAGKAHHTTPVHSGPVSHTATSSPNKPVIPFALQHEMVAPGSQAHHSGPHHPQQPSNGSPGHQGPSPALVVAPKPLTTPQTNRDAQQNAYQAYGAATTYVFLIFLVF